MGWGYQNGQCAYLVYVYLLRYHTYEMSKLTLSVDRQVIERAKTYAKSRGLSVSAMVQAYLESVSLDAENSKMPPVLKSLRGSLKEADLNAYGAHLAQKYR